MVGSSAGNQQGHKTINDSTVTETGIYVQSMNISVFIIFNIYIFEVIPIHFEFHYPEFTS